MNQRTENRLREHTGEGHELTDNTQNQALYPGHRFMRCTCGWFGWLALCRWCQDAKENPLGMCEHCGRFP